MCFESSEIPMKVGLEEVNILKRKILFEINLICSLKDLFSSIFVILVFCQHTLSAQWLFIALCLGITPTHALGDHL